MHFGWVKKPIEPNPLIRKSYFEFHFFPFSERELKRPAAPTSSFNAQLKVSKRASWVCFISTVMWWWCFWIDEKRWEISLFLIGICLSGKGSKETMAYALKPAKQLGADEGPEQIHKIRITLTSKSVKNLEKGTLKNLFCFCLLHWICFCCFYFLVLIFFDPYDENGVYTIIIIIIIILIWLWQWLSFRDETFLVFWDEYGF